ncbi:MAG: hypothetical protein Q8J63_01530 [Candidatus Aquicultor sp.]|nr:hypothetical protein [Candidatus Aquicultor sp.]
MKKSSLILIVFILAAVIAAAGCQKAQQPKNTATTAPNPHKSGAVDLTKFAALQDKTVIENAKEKMLKVESFKVISHVTAKRESTTTVDTDFEVVFLSPDKVYLFGDNTVAQKRMEIYQLSDTEYKSFDGVKWKKTKKAFPVYNFDPKTIAVMFDKGTNFRLVGKDRTEGPYKSTTVVIFERPSTIYKGQTEQVVVWIDNTTNFVVRLEVLNSEQKPVTFTEEFLRFFDYNSPELKIELPAEAKAAG